MDPDPIDPSAPTPPAAETLDTARDVQAQGERLLEESKVLNEASRELLDRLDSS